MYGDDLLKNHGTYEFDRCSTPNVRYFHDVEHELCDATTDALKLILGLYVIGKT